MMRRTTPDLVGWSLALARRLLYAWVRPRVLPERVADLGIDPARPVCYALHGRHLSNLLVLMHEARRAGLPRPRGRLATGGLSAPRAFFFVERTRRLAEPAQALRAPSPLMRQMVAAAIAEPGLDVQIVPVTLLWGRAPDKQDSILKALFSEAWRAPGALRQMLAILLHGRQVLVRFSPPLSLRELVGGEADAARAARKLSRLLRVHFRRQREIAIGPDLSHRHTQIQALLAGAPVRAAIAAEAQARRIPLPAAEERAREFALEIVSDYAYGVVRAFELFLSWLWTHLYEGVEVHGFETLERIAPGQGIVYVPCHRSHIDYLLLSYVVFQRGLTPPHIAAGDNLNLPVIGPLLRRAGAFFLRRSFRGEPLYAAVFNEYLHLMIARGFPIEYFIEGGRSRSGAMLAPKAGILGMTVRSFLRDHARPLVFVPVYLGYEKLIEGRSFVGELQGRPKRGESLWGALGALRRIRREFGRVQVSVGEPLALAGFLDQCRPDWRERARAGEAQWLRGAIRGAATELARRINEAVVIGPVNLLALALLATPRRTADEQALCRQIAHCQALLREAPFSSGMVSCDLDAPAVVAYGERLGAVERIAHPLGDLLRASDEQAALLAYFRNNVLHALALPALLACLVAANGRLARARIDEAVAGIHELLRAELFLRAGGGDLRERTAACLRVLVARGLLRPDEDGAFFSPEPNSDAFAELRLLGEIVRPTLERHFLALVLLQRQGTGRRTRREFEESCRLLAERLSMLHEFNTPEFSGKAPFAAFIGNLVDLDLLREDDSGVLHFDARLTAPVDHAELVLPAEARRAIRRMAGEPGPGAGGPSAC